MATGASRFVVCYSLGTGAGYDLQLAELGRQLCEDLAEILTLNEGFVTVPQMLVVREADEIEYSVERNACAFAVFYSLPETEWIIRATKSIRGDIALTGRIMDDETGLLLSVNMIDVVTRNLLFCGQITCEREQIQTALADLGARILSHFTSRSSREWLDDVREIIGTSNFHAYANWMGMREAERRASREGIMAPAARLVEHMTYALNADPDYQRAALKLCDLMANQLPRQSYEFMLRYLEPHAMRSEALAIIVVQCLARLGKRSDAEMRLNSIIEKWPNNGLFRLMRGCIGSDNQKVSRDLGDAERLLGNDFKGCRVAVDNALLNVTGV